MKKESKIRLWRIILWSVIIIGTPMVFGLILGFFPGEIISKETASIVGIGICFPVLFCICCPANFFVSDEKPSRKPAPSDHPIWEKRKLDPKMYGTVQPAENHFLRVA